MPRLVHLEAEVVITMVVVVVKEARIGSVFLGISVDYSNEL